jgi:uncharacterized protein (DUF302 family)
MLEVVSGLPFGAIEAALRRAAHHHGADVVSVTNVGQLLHEASPSQQGVVFGLCQPELHQALLAADLRAAVFLPCRIAAFVREGRVTLTSVSPVELCRMLNRPDLAPLTAPMEALLSRIMHDAAEMAPAAVHAAGGGRAGLGATEEQVSLRGSLPQRIDRRGSKVEDLAGTGTHDSKGG